MARIKTTQQPKTESTLAAESGQRALTRMGDAAALAAQSSQSYPTAIAQLTGENLNLNINISNFRTVAMSFGRRRAQMAVTAAETSLGSARARLKELTAELGKQGEVLLKNYALPPGFMLLTEALKVIAVTGVRYEIKVENPEYSTNRYHGGGKEVSQKPVIDEETFRTKIIAASVRVYQLKQDYSNKIERSCVDEFTRAVQIELTPEMSQLIYQIEQTQDSIEELDMARKACNALLASVEDRADDVETAITLAHLSGQLKSTAHIHGVILSVMFNDRVINPLVKPFLPNQEDCAFTQE